jgi:hypothetical protein
MLSMLLIPTALCFVFGRMVGDTRQGWAVLGAMVILFVAMSSLLLWAEQQGNPLLSPLGIDQAHGALQAGGNMEGKETRFGVVGSALFAAITTAASCGAVNAMHDSFTPLGGLVPMWLMQLGEVVFGGVGSSLISQSFQEPRYFWGRLSATAPMPNNGIASGGSNFGPLNPALIDAVKGRIKALRAADPGNESPTSGSRCRATDDVGPCRSPAMGAVRGGSGERFNAQPGPGSRTIDG